MEIKTGDLLKGDLFRLVWLPLKAQDLLRVGHLLLDLTADPLAGVQVSLHMFLHLTQAALVLLQIKAAELKDLFYRDP